MFVLVAPGELSLPEVAAEEPSSSTFMAEEAVEEGGVEEEARREEYFDLSPVEAEEVEDFGFRAAYLEAEEPPAALGLPPSFMAAYLLCNFAFFIAVGSVGGVSPILSPS